MGAICPRRFQVRDAYDAGLDILGATDTEVFGFNLGNVVTDLGKMVGGILGGSSGDAGAATAQASATKDAVRDALAQQALQQAAAKAQADAQKTQMMMVGVLALVGVGGAVMFMGKKK